MGFSNATSGVQSGINKDNLQWNPKTNQWVNAQTGEPFTPPNTKNTYAPDVKGNFEGAEVALDKYYGALEKPEELTGLGDRIGADGMLYKGYNWGIPEDYELPSYNQYDYSNLGMERTDFGTPEIDALSKVNPMAEGIYGGQKAAAREGVMKQYSDLASQVEEEVRRNQTRPEQAAALLQELGIQKNKALTESDKSIDFESAQQQLDIAKKEQELGLTRSTTQEGLEQQALSNQAGERSTAANYAKDTAQLAAGEGQFGYQQDVANKQYKTGMDVWLQEQKAAEAEKEYQSKYGQAQDLTSLDAQEWEANRSADMDYYNALMQGSQAATGLASQTGTYMTNLPEGKQNDALNYQATPEYSASTYQPQNMGYNTQTNTANTGSTVSPNVRFSTTGTTQPYSSTTTTPSSSMFQNQAAQAQSASTKSGTYQMPKTAQGTSGQRPGQTNAGATNLNTSGYKMPVAQKYKSTTTNTGA
jgi:hypothetical protein